MVTKSRKPLHKLTANVGGTPMYLVPPPTPAPSGVMDLQPSTVSKTAFREKIWRIASDPERFGGVVFEDNDGNTVTPIDVKIAVCMDAMEEGSFEEALQGLSELIRDPYVVASESLKSEVAFMAATCLNRGAVSQIRRGGADSLQQAASMANQAPTIANIPQIAARSGNIIGVIHSLSTSAGTRVHAQNTFDEALTQDPNLYIASNNRATVDYQEGRLDDAHRKITSALGHRKRDPILKNNRGVIRSRIFDEIERGEESRVGVGAPTADAAFTAARKDFQNAYKFLGITPHAGWDADPRLLADDSKFTGLDASNTELFQLCRRNHIILENKRRPEDDQINVPPPLRSHVFDREDTAEIALQEGVGDEFHEDVVSAHKTEKVLFSVVDRLRGVEVFSFNPVGGATPAQGLCNGLRRLGAEYSGVADEIEDSASIVEDKRGVWSIRGGDWKRRGRIRLDEQSQCVNITVGGFEGSFGAEYTEGDHTLHFYSGSVLHANALKGLCNAAPEARTLEEGKMRNAQQIERVKGHLNTTLKEMGDDPARPRAAGSNLGFKVMGGLNRLEINALMEAGLSRGVRHGLAIRKTLELDITGCGEFFAAASLALKEELSRSTPKRPIRSPPPPRTPLTPSPKAKVPSQVVDDPDRTAALAVQAKSLSVGDAIELTHGKGAERCKMGVIVAEKISSDRFKLLLGSGKSKLRLLARPETTLRQIEEHVDGLTIHKVIKSGGATTRRPFEGEIPRPPVPPVAQESSPASGTTPLSRPPTARPPPEPLAPPKVKPPDNPFNVSLRSRLGAIVGRGKERVRAADAVAQWFDGDQFKQFFENNTGKNNRAVAYGLCGRMRDGTADPYIFKRFNQLVSGGVDLTGETGLMETGIPELEQHAQALGLSKDEFRQAFFLKFATEVEKKFPRSTDLVEVIRANTTFGEPNYAVEYLDRFGKEHVVFWNNSLYFRDCPLDDQGNPTGGVNAASGGGYREIEDYFRDKVLSPATRIKGVQVPDGWYGTSQV